MNLGFLGLQDTQKKFTAMGTFQGDRGHAPKENSENGASKIGLKCISCL